MKKILAESLYEYREMNKLNENDQELNEALFGLNDEQKNKIKEIAAKTALEDADVDALITSKLIKPILDSFKVAQPGTKSADLALKAKNMILTDPKKYKETVLKFVKVYAQGLADTSKSKFYSFDPNTKKINVRLGDAAKASVGSELGQ